MLYKKEVVLMPEVIYKVDLPAFTGRNVPIKEIASAIGKDAQYVRLGLQQGILKFGAAIKGLYNAKYKQSKKCSIKGGGIDAGSYLQG